VAGEKRAGINWRRVLPRLGAILFAVAVTVGIFLLNDRLTALRGYGLIGLFFISLLGNATLILPAPSLAAVFAFGASLPPIEVGLVAGAGMAVGELTGYLAGFGGAAVIENRRRYEQVKAYMAKYGLLTIFVLSLIPNPLMDLAGIAAGALKMPVWHFELACFAGKTVKCIAFAYLGAGVVAILPPFFSRLL